MTFITATSLPLLIALAEIGEQDGVMLPATAAALIGAGVLSVLVYPAHRGRAAPARRAHARRRRDDRGGDAAGLAGLARQAGRGGVRRGPPGAPVRRR